LARVQFNNASTFEQNLKFQVVPSAIKGRNSGYENPDMRHGERDMNDVPIGAAARASLNSLRDITNQMAQAQKRLATGKRIDSPMDGPAAFFTASAMRARAAMLNGLMDGIVSAQKTIEAANSGIAAIETLLTAAKTLANQALESADTLVEVTGNNSTPLTAGAQIASAAGSATLFSAGDQVTVSDGTTTATYTAVDGDTVQDFLDAINDTANLDVEASLNGSGQIVLTATDTVDLTVGATLNGAGGATLNSVSGLAAGTTEFEINTTRQSYAQQFDAVLDQIDQAAQDAGYNGTNLLTGGSLTVTFNETGTSSLTVDGGEFSADDLGVDGAIGQFQLDSAINSAVAAVDAALATIEVQSTLYQTNAAVISTREDFTENLAATLTAGADGLVASDVSEDAALLLALQMRHQMATTVLSLTGGDAQSALRLFER
jgi:flagellin-like hook-associated protein FlgL